MRKVKHFSGNWQGRKPHQMEVMLKKMMKNYFLIQQSDNGVRFSVLSVEILKKAQKIIQKTKTYKLASEIINQVQLAGLILCLVYLKANTYILC